MVKVGGMLARRLLRVYRKSAKKRLQISFKEKLVFSLEQHRVMMKKMAKAEIERAAVILLKMWTISISSGERFLGDDMKKMFFERLNPLSKNKVWVNK